jgi:hypothetical protein
MRSRRDLRANSAMHGVMVVQGWRLRGLSVSGWNTIDAASLGCCNYSTCPGLIGRMIEQPPNIVNKERIKLICDLLLVCEIQSSIERNP